MRAGRLNKKVVIQNVTETRDSVGGVTKTWAKFADAWASINPLVGKEYFESKQINAELSQTIRIRYIFGINTKMRILHGARIFEIESVVNVREGNRELVMMCKENI